MQHLEIPEEVTTRFLRDFQVIVRFKSYRPPSWLNNGVVSSKTGSSITEEDIDHLNLKFFLLG